MQRQPELTVIRTPASRTFLNLVAVFLWLSPLHFNFFFLPISLFFLPLHWILTILGLLLALIVSPLYEDSKFAEFIAKFICKHAPGYFPITFVMEDMHAFDTKQSYIFAAEPHAILPVGVVAFSKYAGYLPLKKVKGFASNAVFRTPVWRHIWAWLGAVPAEREILLNHLEAGYSAGIIPGGAREVLYMERDREVVFLRKRHGFIKAAIHTGSPLVPVYMFGQTRVYNWCKPNGRIYEYIARKIGAAPVAFWGIFGSPIPYPEPVYIAVGKPIPVQKNVEPSIEEVEELHMRYLSALQKLFEEHKVAAGYADSSLIVW